MAKGNQGISGKNVRHTSAPKVEPRPHARNPATVAQYGALVGNHITNKSATRYRGDPDFTRKGYSAPQGPTSFSNVGPGGGKDCDAQWPTRPARFDRCWTATDHQH